MDPELYKEATGILPQIFCMDADPAMITAIGYEYSETKVIHCIYHTPQNLPRNLKGKLGGDYQQFVQDFYKCRNTISVEEFLVKWKQLKEQYPTASDYLTRALEPSQKKLGSMLYCNYLCCRSTINTTC